MSGRCPRLAARMAALSLAMEAKCGSLDVATLEALQDRVRGIDDPALTVAVDGFATQVAARGTGALVLAALGQELLDAIERMVRPDPVDIGRRDIHG